MYLPDGLRYSRQLQHLQVHENSLTELPASLGTINIPDQIERTLRLIEPLELRIDDHIETDWKIKETWSHFNASNTLTCYPDLSSRSSNPSSLNRPGGGGGGWTPTPADP